MEKYTKPSVKKAKIDVKLSSTKVAQCGGMNSRKMPDFKFSKK